MAEISWNQFFGGIANDEVLMGDTQYAFSKNIETRETTWRIGLSPKPTLAVTTTKEMYTFVNRYVAWEDGKIYDIFFDTDLGTIAWWSDVLWLASFGDMYVFFYQWAWSTINVGKIDKDEATGTWSSQASYNATWSSFTSSWTANFVTFDQFGTTLYVWWGNKVVKITSWGVASDAIASLTSKVVWITRYDTVFYIYTDDWFKHTWDRVTDNPAGEYILNKESEHVISQNGLDYIVTGSDPSLDVQFYLSQGWDLQLICSATTWEWTEIDKFKFWYRTQTAVARSNSTMASLEEIIYIPTVESLNSPQYSYLYSYGRRRQWFPQSWNVDYALNSSWNQVEILAVHSIPEEWEGNIYISWRDSNSNVWVDKLNVSEFATYTSSGEKYSKKFQFQSVLHEENEREFRADVAPSQPIVVKYALDWSDTRNTLGTLNVTDQKRFRIEKRLQFYEIQFKLELSTTDDSVTPWFYSMRFNPTPIQL